MAADVSTSLLRITSDYNKDDENNNKTYCGGGGDLLVTRDFLGLDLLSAETYTAPLRREVHDLNLPPPATLDGSALDLKLLLPSCHRPAAPAYQSVCTLDKVRSALRRVARESRIGTQHRPQRSDGSAASPSSSTSSSSIKRRWWDQATDGPDSSAGLMAAGCPSCLMYVLISKGNPRCPRCDSHVPATAMVVSKKPKIDLNLLY